MHLTFLKLFYWYENDLCQKIKNRQLSTDGPFMKFFSSINPLYTNEFFHLVGYNEPGVVHCIYQGVNVKFLNKDVFFFCFVALRPRSTTMVMAGRSVHLTTLFPGQA